MASQPVTRNTSSIIDSIDSRLESFYLKFEDFKTNFSAEIKNELSEIKDLIKCQTETIACLKENMTKHESTISVLQNSVEALKVSNKSLKDENESNKKQLSAMVSKINSLEQYGRRQTLRIDGIEYNNRNETSDQVVTIVGDLMKEVGLKVSPIEIDRAHRIGPTYKRGNKIYKTILVKFINFNTRTRFYRKRKDFEDIKIRIDLTKPNYHLLKETIALIQERKHANIYAFADINCRIKIMDIVSLESVFIESIDEVESFFSQC